MKEGIVRHRFSQYPCLDQRSYLLSILLIRFSSMRNVWNIFSTYTRIIIMYKKWNHFVKQNFRVWGISLTIFKQLLKIDEFIIYNSRNSWSEVMLINGFKAFWWSSYLGTTNSNGRLCMSVWSRYRLGYILANSKWRFITTLLKLLLFPSLSF